MMKEASVSRRIQDDGSAYGCIRLNGHRFYPVHPSDVLNIGDSVFVCQIASNLILVRPNKWGKFEEETWQCKS